MTTAPPIVIDTSTREILNYFGKCRHCGYPARATRFITRYSDGTVTGTVVAFCELPCGWRAPAEDSLMTGARVVVQ